MKHILAMLLLALMGASGALAQIYVKVVPEKKTFLSGEAMYMRLTITNNSGVPVELKSQEYSSWLDIHVEHSTAGAELPQSKFAMFPPLKVPAGMSVSRKIDLRHFYDLSREGNYHVQAVVKMPNQKDMFASQKSLFAVRTGTPMWSQTVAIPSSAKRCTFSICTIAVRGIQKLYVQTKDPDTGVAYNAVCIGDWLGTSRPQCMVGGKANVHVFFPTTPMLGAYSRINYRGTMEKLQYYKKVMGTPSMVFLPDGSVRVTGAVHYDPTVQPKTVPDAADVPGM